MNVLELPIAEANNKVPELVGLAHPSVLGTTETR